MVAFTAIAISHWENDFLPVVNALRSRRTITLAHNIDTDQTALWVLLAADEIKVATWPGLFLDPDWGVPSVASQFPDAIYLNSTPSFSPDYSKITTSNYSDFGTLVNLFRSHFMFVLVYDGRGDHGTPTAWAFVNSPLVTVVMFTTTSSWPTAFATDFPDAVYLDEPPDSLA